MDTSSKGRNEKSKNTGQHKACCGEAGPDASLDQKKARVMGPERSWVKPAMIAGAAAIIALVVWVVVSNNRTQTSMSNQGAMAKQTSIAQHADYAVVTSVNGSVRVPLPALDDKKASYYAYSSGNKTIKFFVLRASDGSVRTALDACTVCYQAKLGYRQDGDAMICKNCGMRFQSANIGIITGGCNPIPIKNVAEKQFVVLQAKDLEAGAKYF